MNETTQQQQVAEEVLTEREDGSVVVGAPPSSVEANEGSHGGLDDDDDDRPVTGGAATAAEEAELSQAANDEERERIRERRRQERQDKKNRAREKTDQLRAQLQRTQQENLQLNERLSLLERKTSGSELAQLDSAIAQAEQSYQAAKEQVSDAITRQDGAAAAAAQERMTLSQQRHRELSHVRQQYTAAPQRVSPPLDPLLIELAQQWTSKNAWYDPQGKDVDSRLVLALDKSVVDEGYAPNTPMYWQELDRRVQKYLPHRASSGSPGSGTMPHSEPGRTRPTKSVVVGSGRESAATNSGAGSYTLSPERVQAMKDAGMWDDPKKRNDLIRQYREYDQRAGQRGGS